MLVSLRVVKSLGWLGQCLRHIATSSCWRGKCSGCESKQGDIHDKAALVTGGASGIGLQCCKALLRAGCRGVTIADRDDDCGDVALRELAEEFGSDRVVFVHCDVAKSELVDWAFKSTINAFNRLDIVINNAGVLNDKVWENEIHTNVCGTMVGSLLGLQYMAAHCSGQGGYVVNIASTMGLSPFGGCPIYSMTQSAILGLTRALGQGSHLERTKVKVIGLAVGLTETPLMINATKHAINTRFSADFKKDLECHKWQKPEVVANTVLAAIKDGEAGAVWVVESGSKPYKICIPCYQEMRQLGGSETIIDCEIPGKLSKPHVHREPDEKDVKETDTKRPKRDGSSKAQPPKAEAKKPTSLPKPRVPKLPASRKSSRIHGTCGTCPEPKWHDGPPPKKEKTKKPEDECCDSCDIELKTQNWGKKPKVKYLGKCAPAMVGAKLKATKAPPTTAKKTPLQAPSLKKGTRTPAQTPKTKKSSRSTCECDDDCCDKGKTTHKASHKAG